MKVINQPIVEIQKVRVRMSPHLAYLLHKAAGEAARKEILEAFAEYETRGMGGWVLAAA